MKGIIAKGLTGAALAGGLAGCYPQGKYIDPCYPDRYIYKARQEVTSSFAPQVQNGHILDQTIWNYHFDQGTGELNRGGQDHLDGLVRRRPHPDARVFLATARDINYDQLNPDRYADQRKELDEKRAASIQKYLAAQTSGRPMPFEVVVHDPRETYEHAYPANRAVLLMQNTSSGSLGGGTSATTAGQGQGQQQGGASGVATPQNSGGGGSGGGGSSR